jgi:DNA-binding NarL/FixJ family response regulator
LALACSGKLDRALALAEEAESIAHTIEVRTLPPCIRAIAALKRQLPDAADCATHALQTVVEVGDVDSFVASYRGYPNLLLSLAPRSELQETLRSIIGHAHDWSLAKTELPALGMKRERDAPLSHREEEVLDLIAHGLTNKEIAKTLFISEATAKVHVRHILEKLNVRTRTEAALRISD